MSISLDTLDILWDDFPEYDMEDDTEEDNSYLFDDSDKQLLNKLPEYDSSSDSEESSRSESPPPSPTSTAVTGTSKPSPGLSSSSKRRPTTLPSMHGSPSDMSTIPVIMSTVSPGVMKGAEHSQDSRKIIPRSSFVQASQDVGAFWIDKTLFIQEFFAPNGTSSLAFPAIHRPRGFGKTALLDTISCFVDANAQFGTFSADVFDDTSLYTGPARDSSARGFHASRESMLVLRLDLALVDMESPRGFEVELRVVLNYSLRCFAKDYEYLLDLPPDYLETQTYWTNWV